MRLYSAYARSLNQRGGRNTKLNRSFFEVAAPASTAYEPAHSSSVGTVAAERIDPAAVDTVGQSVLSKGLRKPSSGGPRHPVGVFARR
jgi:hypothetical protein